MFKTTFILLSILNLNLALIPNLPSILEVIPNGFSEMEVCQSEKLTSCMEVQVDFTVISMKNTVVEIGIGYVMAMVDEDEQGDDVSYSYQVSEYWQNICQF